MGAESSVGLQPVSEVRAELDRVLGSACFRNGARLSRLLRHLVESSLEGRADHLKEYTLGTEVFDRPSFDPRVDTVVRSTARHLRFKLDEYYKTEGQGDPLLIELPKGSYVPVFHPRLVTPSAHIDHERPLSWGALSLVILLIIAAVIGTGLLIRARITPVADSMAVLPFENRTRIVADQYLVDGLTEELTDAFVRIPGLRVVARASATAARGRGDDLHKIGADLHVSAILTGSVERSNSLVRIHARLASARDSSLLWSETFETTSRDIAPVEALIVDAASRRLHLASAEKPGKPDTSSAEAHDDYIQGRYLWSKRNADDVRQSVAFFERALSKDPSYALAYTGLADAYGVMAANEFMPSGEALSKAEEAAAHALALDPESTEAHASLGLIKNAEWDWKGAERELRYALKLNPGYAATYQRLALNDTVHGRFDEAETLLRQAQNLDPLNWMLTYNLGENAYYAKRYDEAIEQANKLLNSVPGAAYNLLERAYSQENRLSEARAALEAEYKGKEGIDLDLCRATAMSDPARAVRTFRMLLRRRDYESRPFFVAWQAARLHQTDLAVEWLEKAFAVRDPDLASIRVEPALDSLHGDPRYVELVKKVGLGE